jgi:hypothetical protein
VDTAQQLVPPGRYSHGAGITRALLLLFEFIRDQPDFLVGVIVHHRQQDHLPVLGLDRDREVLSLYGG